MNVWIVFDEFEEKIIKVFASEELAQGWISGLKEEFTRFVRIECWALEGFRHDVKSRIMSVVQDRDVEPMGDFEDCIDEALRGET